MSYLVFYSKNAQRKKLFLRSDVIKCVRSYWPDFRTLGSRHFATVIIGGRRVTIADPIVFHEATTPPTLVNPTLDSVSVVFAARCPQFPPFYISPAGHIRESLTGKLVMKAGDGADADTKYNSTFRP